MHTAMKLESRLHEDYRDARMKPPVSRDGCSCFERGGFVALISVYKIILHQRSFFVTAGSVTPVDILQRFCLSDDYCWFKVALLLGRRTTKGSRLPNR